MKEKDGNNQGEEGIRVFLRVRPSKTKSRFFSRDDIDENRVLFNVPKAEDLIVNNSRTKYAFQFNGILDESAKQDDVFKKIGTPAVQNAMDGFNSTVFAYGQTGSGKTFTITGGPERYADRGIIPRAISMIFNECGKRNDANYSCFISYLELYNESGFDLLAAEHTEVSKLEDMPKVIMREDEDGNLNFKNLSVNPVASEEEALNYLFLGDTNRAIGETDMNQASSRSHCIFTICIERRKPGSDSVIRSKLNLVDLAGSERVHKTASTGQVLREAQFINTSLFFLEMVIIALYEKSKKGKERTHIPYRNSMMTSVLRDSLGGNCKTLMVATISPEIKQTDESISTCNFAQRVALVKNTAQVNEELEPELIIRRLKAEIHRQREEIKFLKGENGEEDDLTSDEKTQLGELVKNYVACTDDAGLDIGRITITKINAVFRIFKEIVTQVRKIGNGDESFNQKLSGNPTQNGLKAQIASLQRTLKQRDQEITILVNMVKQGKKTNFGSVIQANNSTSYQSGERTNEGAHPGDSQLTSFSTSIEKIERSMKRNRLITVCGVERCTDKKVLDDPSLSFNWFKVKYKPNESIEENKNVLKIKYQEAKDTGAIVQKARDNINYLKKTIEQLRRERAMEEVFSEQNEKEVKNYEIDPEEQVHRKEIEKLKIVYKDSFSKLKELKATIEHIHKLMEKGRIKMQTDFDIWYREMSGEPQESVGAYMKLAKDFQDDEKMKSQKKKQYLGQEDHSTHHIQMTGNKEADDDIKAFFKAKEALLARSRQKNT